MSVHRLSFVVSQGGTTAGHVSGGYKEPCACSNRPLAGMAAELRTISREGKRMFHWRPVGPPWLLSYRLLVIGGKEKFRIGNSQKWHKGNNRVTDNQ